MATIIYVKHHFKKPPTVTAEQYAEFKRQLALNPNAVIDPSHKITFTRHYKKRLLWLLSGLLMAVITYFVFNAVYPERPDSFMLNRFLLFSPVFIGGAIVFITVGGLLLEGPSFATYVMDRKRYFDRMANTIMNSADYPAFYNSFYISSSKPGAKSQAIPLQGRKSPVTADSVATSVFHWIDQHYWKVAIVVIALYLLNRFVFKLDLF
ncbi:MAG: hypothetical protein H7Y03_03815 [Chitinophagaceae bacterium]|nr:hypothetical protein [Chitinophagaceae bacterium]